MKTRLTILLPVYNEGRNIDKVVAAIEEHIHVPKELLVVYDFDEDNTVPVVKRIQKRYHDVRLVKTRGGVGLIHAVKTGFFEANGELVVVMPADRADDPRVINAMLAKANAGFDIVCATRYAKGGKKIGGDFVKTLLSRASGILTPIVLGIPTTDLTNGFKLYTKKVITTIPITTTGGWEFAAELTIKAHYKGFRIIEVPAVWKNRIYGTTKFKLLTWLPKYMYWYLWGATKRLGF